MTSEIDKKIKIPVRTSEDDLPFSPWEVDFKNKLIRIKPGNPLGALTLRPEVNVDEIKKQAKPDQVQIGVFFGYSMPVYNSDNEEIFFRENVPGRWDGKSNITLHVLVALASTQIGARYFKFQFSWNQVTEGEVVPATTHDVEVEQAMADGVTQYTAYELEFTLDYDVDTADPILSHDLLSGRLRRIAATSGDEALDEIIVIDWHTHYIVNKAFRAA